MNSKPLTYDSSKTVIQYLNPNTRFLIYSRIPSIRTVERAVPLIIDRLSIQDHKIWVNNTSYKYDIYQVDCKDNLPYLVSGVSSLNEIRTCDVDEFRIRDFITKAGGMLPGNPGRNLFGYFSQSVISTNEDRFQKLDELLEMEKQQLEQLLNFQPSNNSNQDEESEFYRFLNLPVRAYEEEDLKILKNEEMVKKAIEDKKDRIRQMEDELVPFKNRRNNIRPRFEIHLTKSQGDSSSHIIERVNYTGDFHKAEASLLDFMFSKRLQVVRVKSFRIKQECPVRMPPDLKIRIKYLKIADNVSKTMEHVKPFIDESSFPLKAVTIFSDPNELQELDHEFIGNSKYLVCELLLGWQLFQFMQSLRHQNVYFPSYSIHFLDSEDFILLIRNWVETNKPIGTCFTFSLNSEDNIAILILNRVKERLENATAGKKCINIPMRTSAILNISYFRDTATRLYLRMTVVQSSKLGIKIT